MFLQENYEDNFEEVNKHGVFSHSNLKGNKKLFLFRLPSDLVNPSDLINQEMVVGTSKRREMNVRGVNIEVAGSSYCLQNASLLIPDSDSGTLHPINERLSGQIMLKNKVPYKNASSEIDLSQYEKRIHKPPELKPRDFFEASRETGKQKLKSKRKKDQFASPSKLSKSEIIIKEETFSSSEFSPAKKKRKKH